MNIVQQFKYNNSNDYELIKRIRKHFDCNAQDNYLYFCKIKL